MATEATSTEHVPVEVLDVLLDRVEFIDCLREEPCEKRTLAENLGVSRSTVDRAVRELEQTGLAEPVEDGYQATSQGTFVMSELTDLVDTVEDAVQADASVPENVLPLGVCDAMTRRIEFIETVLKGPKDKRTLVEDLGVSRSTVDRAARELESLELITYSADGYIPTPVCERAATRFFDLTDAIELRRQWEPFLRWVPNEEFDLDLRLLEDAELVVAEPGDPWAMINRHVQLIGKMDRGRFVLPYTGMHAAETAHEQIVHNGAVCELIVEPSVAETFQSNPDYAQVVDEIMATGRLDVFIHEGELPYGLALVNGTAQIIVADGDDPRALAETDAPDVWDWMEETYNDYRSASKQMT
jgi:predicted transcriptional regulator